MSQIIKKDKNGSSIFMKLNFTGEMQELIAGIELLSKELDFVISPEGINIRVERRLHVSDL